VAAAHLALARYHVVHHPSEPARLTRILMATNRIRAQVATDPQLLLSLLARTAGLLQDSDVKNLLKS